MSRPGNGASPAALVGSVTTDHITPAPARTDSPLTSG